MHQADCLALELLQTYIHFSIVKFIL
jgi:hypothetical protein